MKEIALALIRIYQMALSPWLGPCCRFSPSCSEWARQVIREHGVVLGGWMSLRRLLSCHPFHPGGYDPPPPVTARE